MGCIPGSAVVGWLDFCGSATFARLGLAGSAEACCSSPLPEADGFSGSTCVGFIVRIAQKLRSHKTVPSQDCAPAVEIGLNKAAYDHSPRMAAMPWAPMVRAWVKSLGCKPPSR